MGFRDFLRIWHADRVISEIKCPFCKKSIANNEIEQTGSLIICPNCKRRFRSGST